MSDEQKLVDEIEGLEEAYSGPPTTDDSGDRQGHHQWRHSWPPGSDGYQCVHCGLVVSMSEFPKHRDGLCADWPVLGDRQDEEEEVTSE
jgi:hypothetical protein